MKPNKNEDYSYSISPKEAFAQTLFQNFSGLKGKHDGHKIVKYFMGELHSMKYEIFVESILILVNLSNMEY